MRPGSAPFASLGKLFISVVVPTRDRPDRLGRCLAALGRQTWPRERFEVVVADDASVGDTASVVASHGAGIPVRLIRLPDARGPAAARNAGWRAAVGQAVLFLDDDVEPAPDLLAVAAEVLASAGPGIAGVEGQVQPEDAAAAAASPFVQTLRTQGGGHTCNIAYWKTSLEAAGGFDEGFPLPIAEDYDLAYRVMRVSGPIIYEPRLHALHAVHGERGLVEEWRRRGRARTSLVRLFLKHPDRFPPRFLPAALWRPLARLLRRPSVAAVATYFLLQNAVALAAQRRLLLRRPMLLLKWACFLAWDSARICIDLPLLARTHRAVSRELARVGSAGTASR